MQNPTLQKIVDNAAAIAAEIDTLEMQLTAVKSVKICLQYHIIKRKTALNDLFIDVLNCGISHRQIMKAINAADNGINNQEFDVV